MGKLSSVSAKQAIHAFQQAGFMIVSQRGSHIKMRRHIAGKTIDTIILPNHKHIKEGTLRKGILRPIKMTPEEFIALLKK